jgi:type I restriction enzyme S subunit
MFKAASYVGSKLCQPGDIVINTLWAWMAALGASCHRGIVSPAYGVYRPHSADSFNPAYLDYLLRTRAYVAEYIGRSTGIRSSRLRLYPNQFLDIPLIQPPRPEQDQIVAYLRAQDAHIARFIKAKRELIKLLTEQKLRIIDHAVTCGLDPTVTLKPSGIEWMGEVPEHWEVKPLKRWVRLNARTLGEKTSPDFEFRYVDIGSVQTGRLSKELERIRFEAAPSRARRVLRRGDTIISTVRTYLKAIWYVSEDADDLIASTGFAVLTPGKNVEPEYLGYVIQSSAFVNRVAANSIGIAYPAIAETVLGRFPVAFPPTVEEQQAIVAHIKTESAPLDDAIARTEEEIKLIREYRDRQIADVVTGQVDVRGWQPGPDDVVDDAALAALGDDQEDVTEEEDGDGED